MSARDDFWDDPVTSKGATTPNKSDIRRLRLVAKREDDLLTSTYEEGLREGKHQAKAKTTARRKKVAHAGVRRTAKRVNRPVSRGTAQAVRQLESPIVGQVAGLAHVAGLSLAVVGLYLFLENATAVKGALGSVARGLEWLKAPNTSVPYVAKER